MHFLFKMTAVAIFLAAVPFSEAMETKNFLSENLRELLTKADSEAFLVVSGDPLGLSNGCTPFYTKCTDFKEDPKGNFVNSEGKYLQIFKTLDTGYVQVADQMTTVQMITASSRDLLCCSAVASTSVTLMNINLSACAPIGTVITLPFDVLDSLGVSHTINFNFNKLYVNPDSWVVYSQCVDATFDAIYTAGVPIVFDS